MPLVQREVMGLDERIPRRDRDKRRDRRLHRRCPRSARKAACWERSPSQRPHSPHLRRQSRLTSRSAAHAEASQRPRVPSPAPDYRNETLHLSGDPAQRVVRSALKGIHPPPRACHRSKSDGGLGPPRETPKLSSRARAARGIERRDAPTHPREHGRWVGARSGPGTLGPARHLPSRARARTCSVGAGPCSRASRLPRKPDGFPRAHARARVEEGVEDRRE